MNFTALCFTSIGKSRFLPFHKYSSVSLSCSSISDMRKDYSESELDIDSKDAVDPFNLFKEWFDAAYAAKVLGM